jgi:exopolysaccharide production protein ExoZ
VGGSGLRAREPVRQAITMGLPSAVLVLAAAYLSQMRPQPSMAENAFGRLGDASYSIYLVQVFTISAAGKIAAKIFPTLHVGRFILLATAFTVFAGWLASVLIEKPLLSLSRSYTARNSRRPAVIAVTSRGERPD